MKRQLAVSEGATHWRLTQRAAAHYEKVLVPALFEPWAVDLVSRCGVDADSRVLDLACGTGAVARAAGRALGAYAKIIGVDVSEAMLRIARQSTASDLRVEWRTGDAASLPFPDVSLDAVLCQQGFQFFGDPERAVVEIARVLRPKGRLALSIWCREDRNPLAAALISTISKWLGEASADVMRRPFSFRHWGELHSMIAAAGLRVSTGAIVTHDLHAPEAVAFLSGHLRALPFDFARSHLRFGELVKDLLYCVKPYVHADGSLEIPFEAHTIIATRTAP